MLSLTGTKVALCETNLQEALVGLMNVKNIDIVLVCLLWRHTGLKRAAIHSSTMFGVMSHHSATMPGLPHLYK